jgi:glutaminyl-tRNA synthetase
MVRLKSAYIIRCEEVIKDASGQIHELRCTYIPESKSGSDASGIKVKGTLHWVSVAHATPIEVRLYDRLFKVENVSEAEGDFKDHLNEHSLDVVPQAFAEPSIRAARAEDRYQFIRKGYFTLDPDSKGPEKLVFNRTVPLHDLWAKTNH